MKESSTSLSFVGSRSIQPVPGTSTDTQAQVVRYRIQADLTKVDGRWLLSGLTGL